MNNKTIIIFILMLIRYNLSSYLIYPFKQKEYNNLTNPTDIFYYLKSLEFYTNISIAEPTQTIRSFIDFTKFHFYISNVTSNREYFIEKSESFNTKYDHDFILYTYSFVEGKYANETLIVSPKDINSTNDEIIKIKNFTFSMPTKYTIKNRKMFPSSIGLGFYASNSNKQLNFLMQLCMKNVINESYFFVDFDDDTNGNLYIGDLPHLINGDKYKFDKYTPIYTNIDNILDEWSFRCDCNYNYVKEKNNTDDSINKKNMKIVLDLNLNGMILAISYFKIFNQTFFSEYLNNKICFMKKDDSLSYIYCDKDKVNIKKFKDIYFYQKDINYTFHFDYRDLFIVKNDILFFNIFFDENDFAHLANFGKIFFVKYLLVFNYDKKMIGFYTKNTEENSFISEENLYIKIILIIFMILLAIVLVVILIKYLNKKSGRKIRKNELDEDYDYSIQNNDEDKNN